MLQKIADAPHIEEALLNLGGNLYLRQKADAPFAGEVAIRSPFGEKTPSATITNCNGRFISTSSAAERGRHILDPISGQPAQSAVSSATAVTECGTDSDVFSTAVFIGGKAMAERLVQNTPGTAFVILTAPGEAPLTMGDIALKQFSAEKSGNSN
jgi:thiamine biosynthesis lipoprotein